MFKKKFIELNKRTSNNSNFEIISDKQSSSLIGGCGRLQSCGVFSGSCDRLVISNCGTFYWQLHEI
jgi:hypothetical protein